MLEFKKEIKIYEESYNELYEDVEKIFYFTNKEMKYDFNGFDKDGFHKHYTKH